MANERIVVYTDSTTAKIPDTFLPTTAVQNNIPNVLSSTLRFSGTTNAGLTVNSLTTTQRDALTSPVNGTIIYNTTTNTLQKYENNSWANVTNTAGSTAFADNTFRIQDNADATKQLAFEVSTITTGTTRTITLPNASGTMMIHPDYIVDTATTGNITVTGEKNKVYRFAPPGGSNLTSDRTITLSTSGAVTGAIITLNFYNLDSTQFAGFRYIIDVGYATRNVDVQTSFDFLYNGTQWDRIS